MFIYHDPVTSKIGMKTIAIPAFDLRSRCHGFFLGGGLYALYDCCVEKMFLLQKTVEIFHLYRKR